MTEDNYSGVNRRSVLEAAGAFGAILGLSGITSATPGREPGPKKDELIVGVDADVSDIEAAVDPKLPSNATIVHTNETLGYASVEIADEASIQAKENVQRNLMDVNEVQYTEDNVTYHALEAEPLGSGTDDETTDARGSASPLYTPNDPSFGSQYAPQQVNCEEAWEETLGDPNVTIAIVDQGIQYDHPDLAENMDDSVSNNGKDFVDGDGDPYPADASENHGTHVGGIAGGGTDNGTGHAGISNCSLLSARALGSGGGGSLSDIADAVQWSADQGADIINMSLGGGDATNLMRQACEYAQSQGSLLVAAAGNDSGSPVSYPAAYDTVLAVSSLDEGETLSDFSNVGPEIELAAPGGNVLSSIPFDDYDTFSGTSMASPVVAGVAGLTLSAWPSLSNDELRTHLHETAVDIGLDATEQGNGRVDAANAVTTEPGTTPDPDPDPEPGDCGDEVNTASKDGQLSGGWWGNPSDTYTYTLKTANPCSATVTLEGPASADFDLYLTLDGRTPTRQDYDKRSASNDSSESIDVDLSGDEEFGILVRRYSGSGSYTVGVEELGK
ncbi:S8 family serine peptidase [Natrinema thermotolerans]|uniref:S8 family serine peptidase n=1 Tax=Natrinema thermotolerans TaxID=121872 RepID=A0AAF0PB59_9EURY|nr:S8 family serine peptidase [Natrinema thermotolerans]QCC60308.1 peptidase S8 [Natrinema thermotolerans]QCC61217.1 peptidase S8 [Natrinema thermotolerans]WMT07331.1 S8 family serine peptidase [Natrinema thermotolerans]